MIINVLLMGRQTRFLLTFSADRHNGDYKPITNHQPSPISTQINIFWDIFKDFDVWYFETQSS